MNEVLVIAPLSPPITGQQHVSNELVRTLRTRYVVRTIDYAKSNFTAGIFSVARVWAILGVALRTWRRSARTAVTYLTVSQSLLGNLRDLLIIAASRSPATILHLHGSGIAGLIFRRYPLLRLANRLVYRRVTRAIVLSKSLAVNYEPVIPKSRITVVSNFVDSALAVGDTLVAKHDDDDVNVLYLSNMIATKGYGDLLAACALLSGVARTRVRVTFAGKFDSEAGEAVFRQQLRGLKNVQYLGAVSKAETQPLLARAHVFCLPSYYPYEGQPLAILEAYSNGCIVMTTDQGGIPDIFRDGVNGFQVKSRSPEDIASRLTRLVGMPADSRRAMARANIRYARESFSRECFERNILGLFDSVIREG